MNDSLKDMIIDDILFLRDMIIDIKLSTKAGEQIKSDLLDFLDKCM